MGLDVMLNLRSKAREPKRRRRSARPRDHLAPTRFQQFLGWCVHGYTALGLVAAALIAVLVVRGGSESFGWAFLLMALATIVDATDGTLARRVRIKEVVPGFDGRRLDDIIDFLNYTFLPILLVWRAEILPKDQDYWLIFPLLASIYGFCQVKVKTDDGYFLGFPSLWNVVAFYLYVLPLGPWASLGVIVVLSVFTFVPSKYLYPSQPGRLNQVATVLGVLDGPIGMAALAVADEHDSASRSVHRASGRSHLDLPGLLPGRFLDRHADPLDEAGAEHRAIYPRTEVSPARACL